MITIIILFTEEDFRSQEMYRYSYQNLTLKSQLSLTFRGRSRNLHFTGQTCN